MDWRTKKRLIYILIPFSFFILIYAINFFLKREPVNPCFNKIKDPNEEGVDCGGSCPPCELKHFQSLRIYDQKFIIYPEGKIDLIAHLENPNQNLAIRNLKYQFFIYDQNGLLRSTTTIESIDVFPKASYYLIKSFFNKNLDYQIGKVELKIFEPKRTDFLKMEPQNIDVSYYFFNEGVIFKRERGWEVDLALNNISTNKVQKDLEVIVFVYSPQGELIGLSKRIVSLEAEEIKKVIFVLPELTTTPYSIDVFFQKAKLP